MISLMVVCFPETYLASRDQKSYYTFVPTHVQIQIPPTLQTLREQQSARTWTVRPETIVIGGTVYQCEPYLDLVLHNILKITQLFSNYVIVVAIDVGEDRSLEILQKWKAETLPNMRLIVGKHSPTARRTDRIKNARNRILDEMRQIAESDSFPHFIMMDMDDVSAPPIQLPMLQDVLNRESEWDAMTFPGWNSYYDIWAMSCLPFVISYVHFETEAVANHIMVNFILKKLDQKEWIPCQSAFGGFAIYKTFPFLKCSYDNSHERNMQFLSPQIINENLRLIPSPLISEIKEDCEHRFFHFTATFSYGARMFIYPYTLFPFRNQGFNATNN
jgi:hypothetical protein